MTTEAEKVTQTRTCEQHGTYESSQWSRGFWSRCPSCEAAFEQRRRDEEARREEERQKGVREGLLADSGIRGRFLQATFDAFEEATSEQRKVKAVCQKFVENFRRDQGHGLLLIGPVGTGKTHLACAIALEIIQRQAVRVSIATAREIVRRLRGSWRRGAEETEQEVIDHFGRASLLILDEVGAGFDSDAERVQLFDVLDLRYQLQRPTVVLSNLDLAQLQEAIGARSFDRIREGSQALVCNWPSYRGRAPK